MAFTFYPRETFSIHAENPSSSSRSLYLLLGNIRLFSSATSDGFLQLMTDWA